jgi:hypothetical protein
MVQDKRLSHGFSAQQMFKAIMAFLAQTDLSKGPVLRMRPSLKQAPGEWLAKCCSGGCIMGRLVGVVMWRGVARHDVSWRQLMSIFHSRDFCLAASWSET